MTSTAARRETPCERLVKQEIRRRGPMTFFEFVDLALYHPQHGYYNQSGPLRGRAGDYFTSMQVSRLFPSVFADALRAMRETLDCEQFTLIEAGSGSGEFLEGVLEALKAEGGLRGLRVWSVERSRPGRDRLWRVLSRFPKCEVVAGLEDIEWFGSLEGCLVSNELFDALPFHRLRLTAAGWREIFVALEGDELVEREGELSSPHLPLVAHLDRAEIETGQEVEVRPEGGRLLQDWGQLLLRGYAVTFDYGHPRRFLYSPSRPRGTWRCFSKHQGNERPFDLVGRQDITADVDFTQLAEAGEAELLEPRLFCSQGSFLTHVGAARIEKLLSAGSDEERRRASGVVRQLVHPGAMGDAFWVLAQAKGVELPELLARVPDRRRRLHGS